MSESKIVEEYPPERRITMAIPFKEYLDIPQIPRAVWTRFQETCEAVAKTGREVFTNTETTTANTPVTRTLLVNKMRGDWMFMMDADAFPASADGVNRLLAAATADPQNLKKIIAAPSTRANYPFMSAFGNFNPEGMAIPWRYGYEFNDEEIDTQEECVREVEWTGFHYVLIHRTVFEKVAFPWFSIGVRDEESGITYGHDIRFCRLAARAGFDIYIDFSVKVGHFQIKPSTLADQRLAVATNPEIKEHFAQLSVDVQSLEDDEGTPLNFVIPDPSGKTEGRPLSEIKVPQPKGIILPKEALQ
jgi:hypothetical protein